MGIETFSNININPFQSYVSQPKEIQHTQQSGVFTPNTRSYFTAVKPEHAQINALNLKDDLLARILPHNFIAKYLNEGFIKKQIENNPKIAQILKEKGLDVNINFQNMLSIINSHLIPTTNYAKLIMENCKISFSSEDYATMAQAALLHDIGKILIPTEILNKNQNLTQQERSIIELHDTLGVELLKNTQLNKKILTLIGAHHNYDGNEDNSTLTQILKIADIYSALKENRAYKNPLNDETTFKILYEKAQNGEFDKYLVDVLKQATTNPSTTQKLTIA